MHKRTISSWDPKIPHNRASRYDFEDDRALNRDISRKGQIARQTNQPLTTIPRLDGPETGASALLTAHKIIFPGERTILTAENARGNTHAAFPTRRNLIQTARVLRLALFNRHRILRDCIPECIAVVALEPERVILGGAVCNDISRADGLLRTGGIRVGSTSLYLIRILGWLTRRWGTGSHRH